MACKTSGRAVPERNADGDQNDQKGNETHEVSRTFTQ